MKNISKITSKIIKILGVLILVGVTIYSTIQTVNAAPSTIQISNSHVLSQAYINDMKVVKKTLTDGTYVYCLNRLLGNPRNTSATLVGEMDAGFAYLLQNGYPAKSITGDADKDYYITQSAIWWYLDDTAGGDNLSSVFKQTASDPYGLRPYIKTLLAGAKTAKAQGYLSAPTLSLNVTDKSMNLSSDKKYFVSQAVTGSATNITGNYSVSITSGPTGTIITDTSGNVKTAFAAGEKFLVKVPFASLTSTSATVKVTATASQTVYKAYEYTPGDATLQNVQPATLSPVTKTVSSSKTLEISTSKLTIVKLDKSTNQTLAGAELQLTDKDGTVITTWTSTTKAHVINNLPDGTYYLTEISAPKGYKLNKEPVKITISQTNRDVQAKIYNTAKQVVINVVKVDKETQTPLSGAVLVIKDANRNEVARFTTTKDPYVLLDLEYGTYTVEEISAPDGYTLSNEIITFTVDEDNESHQITFTNEKVITVPDTMTSQGMITTILGTLVIAIALGFVYYNGKKQRNN